MRCPNCSFENPAGMKFCGDCGSPLAVAQRPMAERRQLTVLFCDVVGSTALSERLDPEDLRDVLNRYQQVAVDLVTRHRGTVGKYLGDGLLVYFGYPTAGEDDAVRAVRAALEMVGRVSDLGDRLEEEFGVRLRTRVGIHTGVVIAGEIGATEQRVVDIVGETPNIAARLQDLAAPDSVVLSVDTHRLVSRFFRTVSLGERMLKGLTRAVEVFTVEGETGARNRLEGVHLNALVGRDSELNELRRLWNAAARGDGQAVLISGEAGIGKSRLTIALEDEVGGEAHIVAMSASAHGANSAFAPVVEMLRGRMGIESGDSDRVRLAKIETYVDGFAQTSDDTAPLLADLLSVPHGHLLALSPEARRARTEELLLELLAERSNASTVLFTVEDLHWVDPSTLRLLDLHMARMRDQRILTVFTARPEFEPSWSVEEGFSRIALARLDAAGTSRLVHEVTGGADLPEDVMAQILAKTEGVPLYVEELVQMVVESRGPGSAMTIPATLQDSLMARLDRLNPTKDLIQYASLLGRTFPRRLLGLLVGGNEATLELGLVQVVAADMIHPDGENYRFKHALIQDAAYDSMLRSTRQERHLRVARILQEHFPETVAQQPEVLARHLSEGGAREEAVGYWEEAGRHAALRAANQEAVGHFRQALDALMSSVESPERLLCELSIQSSLGTALMATRGFADPSVEHCFARARAICHDLGDGDRLFPVLWGLWAFYFVKGDLITASGLARQVDEMATASGDPQQGRSAAHAMGYTLYFQGDFRSAAEYARRGIDLYGGLESERAASLAYSMSSVGACSLFGSDALWMLGQADESRRLAERSLALARDLDYAPCLMYSLTSSVFLLQTRGELDLVLAQTEEIVPIATTNGAYLWLGLSLMFRGWALAMRGDPSGDASFDQGYAIYRGTGTSLIQSQLDLLLAERHWRLERIEEALECADQGLAHGERTSEGFMASELHRLKGRILAAESRRQAGPLGESLARQAEASLCNALETARRQGAAPLVARAEASLEEFRRP